MKQVGLKIMLEGGHAVQVLRSEAQAKETIKAWEESILAKNRGTIVGELLPGAEAIQGQSWWWSVRLDKIVGMHTFIIEGDPAGGSFDVPPWQKSGK